uniref:ribonuclease P protein subunit p14 n=1 Tax=Myxine glutinosa TaxID=7769 RepID=UPI00358F354C
MSSGKKTTLSYEKITYRNAKKYFYLRVCLEFQEPTVLNAVEMHCLVTKALKELHGDTGTALLCDLIHFDSSSRTGILRVYCSGLVRLWSALTMLSSFRGHPCAVRIMQVSPFLLSLSGDSRSWTPPEPTASESQN